MLVACGATVRKRARGDPDPYFQPLNTDVYNGHRAVTAVVADGHLIHDVWGADPSTGAITRLGELFPPVYCASAFWNDDGNSAIRFYRIDAGGTPVKEGTTPVSATNAFDVRLAPLGVSGVIQSVRDDDGENEVELTVYEAARKSDNTVAADLVVRHSAEATMSGPPRARRPAVSCHFTTRYLRWVTSGASTTRTGSRLTSAPAMLSKSRVPSPSTTETTLSCSSSTRPAARYCWMTFAPPPSETSLPAAASSACASADSMPVVTNVNVVPPCFSSGSRSWCVSTKTAVRNGGSSPHQPSQGSSPQGPGPPPNMLRPITVAPMFSSDSSTTSVLALTSPPSSPCGLRQVASLNAHSCSCVPPSPSGCSSLGFGPAMKPSTDIETSNLSFAIVPPVA